MDSTAYRHFTSEIISNTNTKICDLLPIRFLSENILPDKNAFDSVVRFLEDCIVSPQHIQEKSISVASILKAPDTNFFSRLFKSAHENIADFFSQKESTPDLHPFKRNGTELLRFLCNAASSKWIPLFRDGECVDLAMSLFLIEAFMNAGWCPNAFEEIGKRTAHAFFVALKKSLYRADDADLSAILGYVQSAWICAQKTEGIKDKIPEWEKKDYCSRYSWELRDRALPAKIVHCAMFRFPEKQLFFILPRYDARIQHPCAYPGNEHTTGLIFYSGNEPIIPQKIIDYKPIQRPKFKGEQVTCSCTLSGQQILWLVVLQVFESTLYRIDLLKPANGTCTISNAELRIENSIPVLKTAGNRYSGRGTSTITIEFLKNPCCFEYDTQEAEDISLFKGMGAVFSPENPLELITAWSSGKNSARIDETNLLGVFEFPD